MPPIKVLAHFVPGERVTAFVAPHSDWLDVTFCAEDDDATFYRLLPEAEVLWHVLRPLSASDIRLGSRLRLVHKLGAGVNTIAVDTATERGIAVANMPGANAPSVAEGTLLLMLAALRRLPELDAATRAGRGWPPDPGLGDTVRDIGGCTVGLIGYGNVATSVERIVTAMGAQVVHTSTRDDATHGLLGREALAAMKPGAVLVNTSRGPIVDESALADALRSGHLAAAGLDVFGVEPVPPDNPLLALPNVVLTPHVTWYTADTMRRYLEVALDNCERLRDGKDLANLVNQVPG